MPKRANLRLIECRGPTDEFGLVPQGSDGAPAPIGSNLGRPMLRRPGDHVEMVWLEPARELRLAAAERGLHPDTAVAIVIERRLAISELLDQGGLDLIERLDQISEARRPKVELWSAHAAYLGHLLRGEGDWKPTPAELGSSRVALPIRIIDRVRRRMPDAIEAPDMELGHSITWEVAALLGGETLSEWAYRSALLRPCPPVA